jgi:NAD(P)-dependent dehydrogenase (short-subunit alcohol dehydrogenase family)
LSRIEVANANQTFRTALVTGGRSGIGAAAVRLLEDEGAVVQVLDLADGFDVADQRAWADVRAVELAFLNAGIGTGTSELADVTDDAYRRILATNVDGVVLGVRRLAAVMEPGGAIVVTASLAGLTAMPADPLYALTKHALVGFVRSVAPQLAARSLTINAVAPGIVDTPLLGAETRERIVQSGFPLLRPQEVAAAALVAARSGETGQVWAIQPGREPLKFRFPNVPGPRTPGSEGRLPPL